MWINSQTIFRRVAGRPGARPLSRQASCNFARMTCNCGAARVIESAVIVFVAARPAEIRAARVSIRGRVNFNIFQVNYVQVIRGNLPAIPARIWHDRLGGVREVARGFFKHIASNNCVR